MEPTEGYSFSSQPEKSAEQERQEKLRQINNLSWRFVNKQPEEHNDHEASRWATTSEDAINGIEGYIYIFDCLNHFVIDYTTSDPDDLRLHNIQRFVIRDNGYGFTLTATPILPKVTPEDVLSQQVEDDEYLDITNAMRNLLVELSRTATDEHVEKLLELMRFAEINDEHVGIDEIEDFFDNQSGS